MPLPARLAAWLRSSENPGMNAPARNPAVLFTQNGCPDSARVRACLLASDVPFVERNVSRDDDAASALMATGVFATPVVASGDRIFFGANLPNLARALGFACRCPSGRARG